MSLTDCKPLKEPIYIQYNIFTWSNIAVQGAAGYLWWYFVIFVITLSLQIKHWCNTWGKPWKWIHLFFSKVMLAVIAIMTLQVIDLESWNSKCREQKRQIHNDKGKIKVMEGIKTRASYSTGEGQWQCLVIYQKQLYTSKGNVQKTNTDLAWNHNRKFVTLKAHSSVLSYEWQKAK